MITAPQRAEHPRAYTKAANLWDLLRKLVPGSALASVVAIAATSVSTLHGGPQLLYALLFGVAFHYLSQEVKTRPGIEFCGRAVLRLGVGLLGARITAAQIVGLGWETALTVDRRSGHDDGMWPAGRQEARHDTGAAGAVGWRGGDLRRLGSAGDLGRAAAREGWRPIHADGGRHGDRDVDHRDDRCIR